MSERIPLNAEQERAVTSPARFVLVSAGAGTGKTLTLARRTTHLVEEKKVDPSLIWALTFTNRAAEEMRERIQKLLKPENRDSGIWVGTIHALGAELIRLYNPHLSGPLNFTIADGQHQVEIVRILKEIWAPRFGGLEMQPFLALLSDTKNDLVTRNWTSLEREFRSLYEGYLSAQNILDYDDLILQALHLLEQPQLEKFLGQRFAHVLVDEYQDINLLQYRLIQMLVKHGGSLFAIGDADQCIYGFRGAYVGNFLNFSKDYPGAATIPLTTNYRCTNTILAAAQDVIRHNRQRLAVSLCAHKKDGWPVKVFCLEHEKAEARFVVREIERLLGGSHSLSVAITDRGDENGRGDYHFSDFLVTYRTHAVAREIKAEFYRAGLPVSELSADLLEGDEMAESMAAYVRLLWNPHDDRAFFRAVDTPGGPGRAAVRNLLKVAANTGMTLWEAVKAGSVRGIGDEQTILVENWCRAVEELKASLHTVEFTSLMVSLLERFDLASNVEHLDTHEPWQHLLNRSIQYEGMPALEAIPRFLAFLAVQNSSERIGPRSHTITLLTLHAAKGLEYPVVFVVGTEEGIIPFRRTGQQPNIEEERRLFYVGMTRAKERLYITYCRNRFMLGNRVPREPSPFIGEISNGGMDFQVLGSAHKPRKSKQLNMW
jgi:DNA helicase-2/ATP-dependent DNA helicase PcrA